MKETATGGNPKSQLKDSPLNIIIHNKGYWEVSINNPPLNLFDPELYNGLEQLLELAESDPNLKVIVFTSAVEDFFMAHFDMQRGTEILTKKPASGLQPWTDLAYRLFNSEVLSIVSVRGRARGVGLEFITACDMCFASVEKAIFGQMEVGAGTIPGGGNMENLPLIMGRARALEIILGADDFNAFTAEKYGLINRAIPDIELDDFVHNYAMRISQFDKAVTGKAKTMINNRIGAAKIEDLIESRKVFIELNMRPERKATAQKLTEWGIQTLGDFELNVGKYLANI